MRNGRDILHLPVVDLSHGARVGTVRDLVLDLDHRAVAALLLAHGRDRSQARLVPFESIRRIGPYAVTVESESAVVSPSDQPRLQSLYDSPVKVVGTKVITENGELVGTVSDVIVDERSGAIEQYQVSAGILHDVFSGRTRIPASTPTAMGDEFMVVPESALAPGRLLGMEAPALAQEASPGFGSTSEWSEIEEVAANLVVQQEDLIIGMRAHRTVANDDAGGVIVFSGETISEETVEKAKAAGKVNLLVEAAGEPAMIALSRGLAERYTRVAVDRMAGRTVHTATGQVIVSRGDVVTWDALRRAREAGVMDQLMDAVRVSSQESRGGLASRQKVARALWDQVSERVSWLVGARR